MLKEIGEKAIIASKEINQLDTDTKNHLISDMSQQLIEDSDLILEENKNHEEIKKANNYLKYIVQKEPDNILAWHLKGISHNRLGEYNLANLSAAEEFLRKRDHKNALYFAKKVVSSTNKFSSENIRASDIINLINQI